MRIAVDLNRCQFYAQCCFLAPEAFRLEAEQVLAYHPHPDDALREKVVRAAAACPTGAILIDHRDLSR
ncbi:ferredoxin [Phenylobacterium sp. SCN 70-31]|uniref:ferredoxin n=1 Tax=Phenylobacterium sp. SCN 70-31 TaxID=1660129 RepID=UPI00086D71EA|nr:ferredoxin [Phenylobacterium sp. SCN 70-31]ODT87134.1 MAG: ferredoxin [Phenylobacterium sp. SCN 70-31]